MILDLTLLTRELHVPLEGIYGTFLHAINFSQVVGSLVSYHD